MYICIHICIYIWSKETYRKDPVNHQRYSKGEFVFHQRHWKREIVFRDIVRHCLFCFNTEGHQTLSLFQCLWWPSVLKQTLWFGRDSLNQKWVWRETFYSKRDHLNEKRHQKRASPSKQVDSSSVLMERHFSDVPFHSDGLF